MFSRPSTRGPPAARHHGTDRDAWCTSESRSWRPAARRWWSPSLTCRRVAVIFNSAFLSLLVQLSAWNCAFRRERAGIHRTPDGLRLTTGGAGPGTPRWSDGRRKVPPTLVQVSWRRHLIGRLPGTWWPITTSYRWVPNFFFFISAAASNGRIGGPYRCARVDPRRGGFRRSSHWLSMVPVEVGGGLWLKYPDEGLTITLT